MLAIHEQPYLDLNGNHSNFGSVGKKKKKSFKQANQVLLRTEQRTFFFF